MFRIINEEIILQCLLCARLLSVDCGVWIPEPVKRPRRAERRTATRIRYSHQAPFQSSRISDSNFQSTPSGRCFAKGIPRQYQHIVCATCITFVLSSLSVMGIPDQSLRLQLPQHPAYNSSL
ncbi:hypothetical protein L1887_05943 [Cichorium endivia]|nr:hypothetical protein L1887_05943 [Cichorium endivia]